MPSGKAAGVLLSQSHSLSTIRALLYKLMKLPTETSNMSSFIHFVLVIKHLSLQKFFRNLYNEKLAVSHVLFYKCIMFFFLNLVSAYRGESSYKVQYGISIIGNCKIIVKNKVIKSWPLFHSPGQNPRDKVQMSFFSSISLAPISVFSSETLQ